MIRNVVTGRLREPAVAGDAEHHRHRAALVAVSAQVARVQMDLGAGPGGL